MNLKTFLHQMNITVVNTILTVLFFCGICLIIWEIKIYQKTFIPLYIPLFLLTIPGLLTTPLLVNFLRRRYDTKSIFLQMVFNTVTWGGITVFSFMAANYYLAKGDFRRRKVAIVNTGHLAKGRYGCGNPYAEIKYKNTTKQLVFPCNTDIESKKTIDIEVKMGLFGFEVVTSQTLNGQ